MDSRIERAAVLVQLGRSEAARELLAEVLAGEPESLPALALMADIEYRLGDYQRSVRYSGDALRSLPENASLWRSRAAAFWMLGRRAAAEPDTARRYYADALANALRAVQIDGEDVASLRILAVTQAESDPDTALETVGRALEIDAEDAALHSLHAAVLYSLKSRGAEFIERARVAYHESLRLEPNSAEALYHLGVLDFEHGNRRQAAERLHMAARIDPYYAESARHYIDRIKHEYRAAGVTLVYSDTGAASTRDPASERDPVSEPDLASDPVPAPTPSGPTGEWNAEVLAELRRFDPERWRETTPESFDAGVAVLRDQLAIDPRNAAAAHELALTDWLCGRRRAALARLRKVGQWDSERGDSERAEQVARHIVLIESETERAEAAKVEREIAAEAARVRAQQRAQQRRNRSGKSTTRELAAATSSRPQRRWGGALLLFPILLFVRLVASGCSADSSGHQPPTVTTTRNVPPYNLATDPAFISMLKSPPPVVPHG
ncbi:tetratricopeptide repeat protein [Nocardia sp. NPDC058058]|uniref:tetratricopeptide repeat protein n=1 Tax=Nocardia sp. NPDC058058 TaxID=3346317 RepID=UPI0036D86D58